MTDISYDVACTRYASDQGLDPIGTILTLSGIRWELWQTGGFCMVIWVAHDNPAYYLWITDADGWITEADDWAMIGLYETDADDSEPVETWGEDGYIYAPLNQLVDTINQVRSTNP